MPALPPRARRTAPRSKAAAAATGHTAEALPRDRRQRVQSAETGMAVLKGLARLGGRASLTALAAQLGEPAAKVHRYLVSLVQEELVLQDAASGHYQLGPEAIQIGLAAMRQADPIRLAEPALQRLREGLEVSCFLAVMGNLGPTIVRMEEPSLAVTVNVRVGSVLSLLWSATGQVFLGCAGPQGDARLLALAQAELGRATPEQRALLATRDPIGALRRQVQQQQLATVKDAYLRGISAVAAPLFKHGGQVAGVLTALGATGGFDPDPRGMVAQAVRAEAQAISRLLGQAVSGAAEGAPVAGLSP